MKNINTYSAQFKIIQQHQNHSKHKNNPNPLNLNKKNLQKIGKNL